jgi:Rod binding domain-containing protein
VSPLPPIDASLLPPEIRDGSKQDKQTYQAALGFERMLLGELTKAMAETAKPSDEGGAPEDAASAMYMQMLPDQLADSMIAGGGLGLADDFLASIKERS